ncbi:Peptidase A1 domain-containing protein [Aphelenchoides fujianensis]|nr:Peptidase A1 domain-containing protein [Aphelenchoides fujianensis]
MTPLRSTAVLLCFALVVAFGTAAIVQLPLIKKNEVHINYVLDKDHQQQPLHDLPVGAAESNETEEAHQPAIYIAHNYHNDYYLTNLSIGTPPQEFEVAVQTGSPSFWVVDQSAHDHQRPKGFDSNSSHTAVLDQAAEFFDDYGNGIAKGLTFTDSLTIGGLTVENQTFGSILTIEDEHHDFPADGVLGLSWSFDEADRNKSEMPVLSLLKQLDQPMYTLWLGPARKPSEGPSTGLLTLGGLDALHCSADVHYVPATKSAYWMSTFQIDGVKIGEFVEQKPAVGILDSGSAVIQAEDAAHVSFYQRQVNATFDEQHRLFTVDCAAVPSLPAFEFTIGGRSFAVQPKDYVVELELTENRCGLAVGHESTLDFGWTLGMPFLRSYCTVFDIGQKRYGFADIKQA